MTYAAGTENVVMKIIILHWEIRIFTVTLGKLGIHYCIEAPEQLRAIHLL